MLNQVIIINRMKKLILKNIPWFSNIIELKSADIFLVLIAATIFVVKTNLKLTTSV